MNDNLVPRALFRGFGGGAPLPKPRKAPWGRGCMNKRYMKGVTFVKNGIQKEKGLDLGEEPPRIKPFMRLKAH